MVEMIVAPEISTLTDETIPISVDNQGNTVGSPVIAKRSAETVVVTANGQTVVIGGLMETLKTEVKKKVPVLGDIPLLGLAFRRTTRDEQKKELMIFLTPHIVNTPEELGRLSRNRTDTLEMAPRAFPKGTSGPVLEGIEWRNGDPDPYYFE
jgi:general secretion pathway protein D